MSRPTLLNPGQNCWRIERADRFAVIIDGSDYFRAVKRAILNAKTQAMLIGWDFDTRIEFEPDGQTIEGPNELGPFLNWVIEQRPNVDIKLLKWNLGIIESLKRGETPLFIINWMSRRAIEIKLDAAHPPAASHHQKVIVIDDNLAFCGGIDITKGRWDTREHLDSNPDRHSSRGVPLGPWHDATTCVDGAAARALGEMARMRWKRATGEDVAVPDTGPDTKNDPWPESLEPQFRNIDVAISRTLGAFDNYKQVSEIEALNLDVISAARQTLYIESQYFASRRLAEAIARRLEEENGPEIVVINPESQAGWLEEKTMGSARAKLLHLVRRSDRHDRFRVFYPVTKKREPIYVHAKIIVADDRLLKLGSANLNNRSMGLDTECDLSVEAGAEDHELRKRIVAVRDDLVSEHLGVDMSTFQAKLDETGSLIQAIDAFRIDGKGLEILDTRELDGADEALSESDLLDPERPGKLIESLKWW